MEINHPKHYNQYPVEVIDMMIRIWGEEATRTFCILNAFKYRMRVGHKDDIEDDLAKEKWYLDKAEELKEKSNPLVDWCEPRTVRISTLPGEIMKISETETGY